MTKEHFEIIYRRYYPRMYRLAKSILYDADESKDVVSDVFAKLLHSATPSATEKTEGYLMAAVRNRCHDVIRHKSVREQAAKLLFIEKSQTTIPDDDDRLEKLQRYIESHLPPLTQQIFRLRFINELTYEEVAQHTGVSRVTVYNHLSQSLHSIKEYFSRQKQ